MAPSLALAFSRLRPRSLAQAEVAFFCHLEAWAATPLPHAQIVFQLLSIRAAFAFVYGRFPIRRYRNTENRKVVFLYLPNSGLTERRIVFTILRKVVFTEGE